MRPPQTRAEARAATLRAGPRRFVALRGTERLRFIRGYDGLRRSVRNSRVQSCVPGATLWVLLGNHAEYGGGARDHLVSRLVPIALNMAVLLAWGTTMACRDSTSPRSQMTPGASSSPAGELPSPRSLKLPRDSSGFWFALDVVGPDHALVQYFPDAASAAERRTQRARLAFISLQTGQIEEFRELDPGEQVGETANDGRFVVWTELGVFGVREARWKLWALDRQTGRLWTIDEDQGLEAARPLYGIPVSVRNGMLVYARLVSSEASRSFEIQMVSLADGVQRRIAAVDGTTQLIPSVALVNADVLWVVRTPTAGRPSDAMLMLTPVTGAPGETLLSSGYSGRIAAGAGAIIASWSSGVWAGNPGTPLKQVVPLGTASYVGITEQHFLWVDQAAHRAYVKRASGGAEILVSETYTQNVLVNDSVALWVTTPALDTAGGVGVDHYILWLLVSQLP